MYQALYRKWRPKTFDEVVGQQHITETLKQQVASGRLSHAYLFMGTRGTGKTTCAKILAKAVNCEHPVNGNPCNKCPSCLGIDSGSIMDVLELDAASNNGVDQIRALREEAIYTPASVKKRVYILDEVHMLSKPAYNALLKILEEPPEHLMFILCTTERVAATIRSRCQLFSFKRVPVPEIAARLRFVAEQENLNLTEDASKFLARLANGSLRDALSLLDECAAPNITIDEQHILDSLGMCGSLEIAALMETVGQHDTAGALKKLESLYFAGKDLSTLVQELSGLTRDLLIRSTVPSGADDLLTGDYSEETIRSLEKYFTTEELIVMFRELQDTRVLLKSSVSPRSDLELALIRLCDPSLLASPAGLNARVARLEAAIRNGAAPSAEAVPQSRPSRPLRTVSAPVQETAGAEEASAPQASSETDSASETPQAETGRDGTDVPASEDSTEETRQVAAENDRPKRPGKPEPDADAQNPGRISPDVWKKFLESLHGKVPAAVYPYLTGGNPTQAVLSNGNLTVYVGDEMTANLFRSSDALRTGMETAASAKFGGRIHVSFVRGTPPSVSTKAGGNFQDVLDIARKSGFNIKND